MKAIILAAGICSRLYPITLKKPKCLLEIGQTTMIDRQINQLHGLGIKDILVVVGYKKELIQKHLGNKVRYAFYDNFAKTNNLHTLYSIKKELDDDVVILFSDVILEKSLLKQCIESKEDFCLIVHNKQILEGTMRVKIKDNSIYDIGGQIPVEEADGNFIGIAKYSKKAAKMLVEEMENLVEGNFDQYYTIALPRIQNKGIKVGFINVDNKKWIEIDTKDNLEKARGMDIK